MAFLLWMGIRRKVINCSSVPISKRLMLVFTQDWAKKPQQLYFPVVNPPGFVLLYRTLVGLVNKAVLSNHFSLALLFQSISEGKFQIAPFRLRSLRARRTFSPDNPPRIHSNKKVHKFFFLPTTTQVFSSSSSS